MGVRIKYAIMVDAPLLASIAAEIFFDTYQDSHLLSDLEDFVNRSYSLPATIADLQCATTYYILIFYKEELAGYARLSTVTSNDAPKNARRPLEIARIYLLRVFQGKGFGKSLIQACVDHSLRHQHDAIWLAVWEHNTQAIEFYNRCGFQEYGETTFPLKSTTDRDLLMYKPV